jgi:hypothetical protein
MLSPIPVFHGSFFRAEIAFEIGDRKTYLIGGDSGGPSFAVVDGKLAILGEHFSTYGTSGLVPFDGGAPKASDGSWWSVDGFLPAYIPQLNSVLPANQQVTMVVPEPSAIMLLVAITLTIPIAIRKRRKGQSSVVIRN